VLIEPEYDDNARAVESGLTAAAATLVETTRSRRWPVNPLLTLKDIIVARWPNSRADACILSDTAHGRRDVSLRAAYLTSPRYRSAIAGGLRARPRVRDKRIRTAYEHLARRLESPEPVSARGMLRLRILLQTAPSAVAVGCPESVVRELAAINFLLDYDLLEHHERVEQPTSGHRQLSGGVQDHWRTLTPATGGVEELRGEL
jgi:hypothetical protein